MSSQANSVVKVFLPPVTNLSITQSALSPQLRSTFPVTSGGQQKTCKDKRRNDSSVNRMMPRTWEFSYLNPRNSYMNLAFDLLNIFPSPPSLKWWCSNMEIEWRKKKVAFIPPRKVRAKCWFDWCGGGRGRLHLTWDFPQWFPGVFKWRWHPKVPKNQITHKKLTCSKLHSLTGMEQPPALNYFQGNAKRQLVGQDITTLPTLLSPI